MRIHIIRPLLAILSLAALTACGDGAGAPSPAATQGDTLVVGAIHVGAIDDGGYNQAMHQGLIEMERSLPFVELIELEYVPETAEATLAMEDLISRGATLIFPMSFGYYDYAIEVAERHPNVVFEHPAGPELAGNLGTFWSDTISHEYLMGIVAGHSTETGAVGWVIGHPVPNILASINAFHLGARSVNPNVETNVVVTDSWVDPGQEKRAVDALAAVGADVVTMIVDSPTTVVRTAADHDMMVIGFHCDCARDSAEDAWLTGIGFEWGPLFTDIASDVFYGAWRPANKVGSLDGGFAQIAPFGPRVSADTIEAVNAARADLIAEKTDIFTGPIIDTSGLVRIGPGDVGEPSELIVATNYLVSGVVLLD